MSLPAFHWASFTCTPLSLPAPCYPPLQPPLHPAILPTVPSPAQGGGARWLSLGPPNPAVNQQILAQPSPAGSGRGVAAGGVWGVHRSREPAVWEGTHTHAGLALAQGRVLG